MLNSHEWVRGQKPPTSKAQRKLRLRQSPHRPGPKVIPGAYALAANTGFGLTLAVTGAQANAGKRAGKARGLMQVTDWTLEILRDEKGELRDHLVNVDQKDMGNPALNIAAGIRWLFRKRETASAKLKRKVDWIWAIAEYKSYLEEYRRDPKHRQMNKFIELYESLENSGGKK